MPMAVIPRTGIVSSRDGQALPSGIYVCRLKADKMLQTRKMVLLR